CARGGVYYGSSYWFAYW
nr:immunoglobulin heavy chain junction region [Mus musculus]NSM06454.1 immunoglobulin heavy chain junction region [Mus musculus]